MASAVRCSHESHLFQAPSILPKKTPYLWPSRSKPRELGQATLDVRCLAQGPTQLPLLTARQLSGGAPSSLGNLDFRNNFGFWQQQKWEQSNSNEERSQMRTMATTRGRTGFSDKQEEEKVEFKITPAKVAVWLVVGVLALTVVDAVTSRTIFNPYFWMYSSWILVKWPWPAAISVGIATLVTAFRSSKRQPKEWEQVLLLLGSLTWLILVPNGLFQGFVDGWPFILFTLYVGFFLISAVVRYRKYGDLASKDTDKQWETTPSRLAQIAFVTCVVGGHWLAAFEAPFLFLSWTFDWKTFLAILTLAVAVLTHYYATYFLGKYFNRLVKPRAVVMFGPYRVIRHPIYASYMLLFAGYCLALRSYKSLLLLLTACIVYYEQRTKLEEGMLVDFFGDLYQTYRERVANKKESS